MSRLRSVWGLATLQLFLGALVVLSTAGGLAGCRDDRCAAGTVLLTLDFDGAARAADRLALTLSVGSERQSYTETRTPEHASDRLEIRFGHYPAGQSLLIEAVASAGGVELAAGRVESTLAAGCSALELALTALADGGTSGDAAPGDAAPDDAAPGSDLGAPGPDGGDGGGVVLIAGQLGGFGNGDGVGGDARFNFPRSVVADGQGALYIADANNGVIRKLVVATGEVTTVAGTAGQSGSVDGQGAAARFRSPQGLATDGTNLYVADTDSHVVRKIVIGTWDVTTLAGLGGTAGSSDGAGAAARFNQPHGLAYRDGTLFVADSGNATLRSVQVSDGSVGTLAGTAGMVGGTDGTGPAARFDLPLYLALDGARLYVSDDDGAIRQVELATAAVTTLAGKAGASTYLDAKLGTDARFQDPRGLTADGAGNLYLADGAGQTIRKIVIASTEVSTLAGQSSAGGFVDGALGLARFNEPVGIAADGQGHLFVTEVANHDVRQIDLAGQRVSTLAGLAPRRGATDGDRATARLSRPAGIDSDSAGNLYVADRDNFLIRRVSPTGDVLTIAGLASTPGTNDGMGTGARFSSPRGVAWGGGDLLYVADTNSSTIREVSLSTGRVRTLAGTANVTGASDDGAGTFNHPSSLASDRSGRLFVADSDNSTIRQITILPSDLGDPVVEVTTLAGMAGVAGNVDGDGAAARFDHPLALCYDGVGALYIADTSNHTVRKLTLDGQHAVSTLSGGADLSGYADGPAVSARFDLPSAIVADAQAGVAWVADQNQVIRKVSLPGGATTTWAGVADRTGVLLGARPARLNFTGGLALVGGRLALSASYENAILAIDVSE